MNIFILQKIIFVLEHSKKEDGLTLIELLIVFIILSLLAVTALPNFLGQVGKARDLEFRTTLGTINRSQQAFHWEKNEFANGATSTDILLKLGVQTSPKYIDDFIFTTTSTEATIQLVNNDFEEDGTRGYSGTVYFNGGIYNSIGCFSTTIESQIAPPVAVNDCGIYEQLQ